MHDFFETLRIQRWDDHRYYHHSRINQSLHLVSAISFLVAYVKIPSIVVTLGMLSILKGGLISVTGGAWISNLPPEFMIAQVRLFGIPSSVYFMVVLTVLAALWMKYSVFGRTIYAIGGNTEAARVSGIRIQPSIVGVFTIHGMFAGIAAILFATQLQVIQSRHAAHKDAERRLELVDAELGRLRQQVSLVREQALLVTDENNIGSSLDALSASLNEANRWLKDQSELLGGLVNDEPPPADMLTATRSPGKRAKVSE